MGRICSLRALESKTAKYVHTRGNIIIIFLFNNKLNCYSKSILLRFITAWELQNSKIMFILNNMYNFIGQLIQCAIMILKVYIHSYIFTKRQAVLTNEFGLNK